MFDHNIGQTSLLLNLPIAVEANSFNIELLQVFDGIYQLLYSIIRYRKQELLALIPIFFGNISSLVSCFTKVETKRKDLYCLTPLPPCSLPSEYRHKITRLLEQITHKREDNDSIKPFAKHIPFLISKILYSGNVNEWKYCLFVCLDCCDDYGRNMVLAQLDIGTREVYKRIVTEWEREHRYTGNA